MGISFFESMSGELVDDDGHAHHVAIDIRCDASRATRFLASGNARVTGTIRALPWTDGAACSGTVVVRPILGRKIEYDMTFNDADGLPCRLWGKKDIRVRGLYRSMTRMNARLERDGKTVATGTMDFHGDDLLSFAQSWSIGPTTSPAGSHASPRTFTRPDPATVGIRVGAARQVGTGAGNGPGGGVGTRASDEAGGATASGGRAPGGAVDGVLTDTERATVRALAETLIVPGRIVPAVDDTVVAGVEEILPHLPPIAGSMYHAGLRALDVAALSRYGKSFAKLEPSRRERLLDVADDLPGGVGRASMFALGSPIKVAHFGRREYLDALGIPDYVNDVVEPRSQWMAGVETPENLEPNSHVECDVVVIGTGAGGGPVAASLAEQGHGVIMVEEGRYQRRPQFSGPPEQRIMRFWRDGGINMVIGNAAIMVPVGRMVGGTTAINSGTCFRTPDAVLAEWRAAGFPEDFEPDRFGKWLDQAESELQVTEGETRVLGRIAQVIAKGATEMGGNHGPLRRNAPDCDGQGICVAGCPTGAKRSSDVSWVPRALKAGARLYTGLPATRILMNGRRAIGALLEGHDQHGAPRRVEIRARAVVVAAGSLLTPMLLQRNGVNLPWLGRNLSIHPGFGAIAMFDEDLGQPWHAVPQGYFVDGIADDRVRFEGYYSPPQLAAATAPFRGAELTRWLDNWGKVGQFGFMVRDTGVGSVSIGPYGRPLIRYSVTPRVLESLKAGSAALAEMMLRGGAKEVAMTIEGVQPITNVHEARALVDRKISARNFRTMAFHPLGTARMGDSPDTAVIDFENRVFGYDGLFVADGSSMPSSLGVNPQITIMALALRAAESIKSHLS